MAAGVLEYAALLLMSFLAATVVPLSSEVVLALIVREQRALVVPVLVATVGNYGGACTTYWLSWWMIQRLRKPQARGNAQHRALRVLGRVGPPALVFSWVPVLGDALVAVAGTLDVPFRVFSFWVVLGKAARYLVVAWTVYRMLGA